VKFRVFDILKEGDKDIRTEPLTSRLEALKRVVAQDSKHIEKVAYNPIKEVLALSKQGGIGKEGIIVKQMNSPYTSSRNDAWRKLKNMKEKVLKMSKYTINNAGIRVENDEGIACQIGGKQSKEVKELIDTQGWVDIYIQYLQETETGKYRFISYRGLLK